MGINTDYQIRKAIHDIGQMVENIERDGPPRRDRVEQALEDLADAIVEMTVHTVVTKLKTPAPE